MLPVLHSLADFKRLAKPGACFLRSFPGMEVKPRLVTVAYAQSNAVAFPTGEATPEAITRVAENPARYGSWFYFPRASRCRFEDGAMTVVDPFERPLIAFRPLPDDAEPHARGDP